MMQNVHSDTISALKFTNAFPPSSKTTPKKEKKK